MWVQSNISSCRLCVWCKSKELGGRGSTKFPTPVVASFSTVFLPAIESNWAGCHIYNFVKHQQRSSPAKTCGVSLDDWANGGNVHGLLHLW